MGEQTINTKALEPLGGGESMPDVTRKLFSIDTKLRKSSSTCAIELVG